MAHAQRGEQFFTWLWRGLTAGALIAFLAPFAAALAGLSSLDALSLYVQQIVTGTATGCVYALVALGIVLIYKGTETINFAQGDLLMLGAFLAFTAIVILGLPWWLGALLACAAAALLGAATERIILRPLIGEAAFSIIMATIGLGFVIRAAVGLIPGWGTDTYRIPTPFDAQTLDLGLAVLSQDHVAVILTTLLLCALLYLFFSRTPIGIAMQAVSENQLAAWYMGIPVKTLFTLIWSLSAAVAAVAGLLLAPFTLVHSQMGLVIFKAFPAAVLGGFTSLPGAVAGGLIIGIAEELAGFYLPEGFKDVTPYILLLIVLVVRPEGLFDSGIRKRV